MLKKYITTGAKETQKLGENFARQILDSCFRGNDSQDGAVVIALFGNLGGGKTTFLQGFAKGLRIKEKILSPTFVILKRYGNFYHIDCYRLKNHEDILDLDFINIISNPKNIVAVEWPEKIKKLLPENTIEINFGFVDENKRDIIIQWKKKI